MSEKHHEMVLEQTHTSGVEEWFCPTCGRRFLVQWPPAYKMIILVPGEQDTRHNVSKLNPRPSTAAVSPADESEPIDESRLLPWIRWMESVNFDILWDQTA